MKKIITFFLTGVALICGNISNAQTIQHILTEGFEGAAFPPANWQVKGSGTNQVSACINDSIWMQAFNNTEMCAGSSNTAPTHQGNAMAGYNSFNLPNGSTSELTTPAQDFSSSLGYYQVTFWMYRESQSGGVEAVDVYVNTSPASTGANAQLLGTVHRSYSSSPAVSVADMWYQYTFKVPATFNTATNYIIFKATSQYLYDLYIDDITVDHVLPCTTPTVQPTGLALSSSISVVNGSFAAASPGADDYLVVRTPGNTALNTNPVAATSYTSGGTLGNGTIVYSGPATSFSDANLTANTTYTYTVFSYNNLCSGGPLYLTGTPLTGSVTTTNAVATYNWNATKSADFQVASSWTPARNVPDPSDMLVFGNGISDTAINVPTQSITRLTVNNNTTVRLRSNAVAALTLLSDNGSTDELGITNGASLILDGNAGITMAFSGGTATIAGNLEVATNSGTSNVNSINFTNVVATIAATGTLAAGGSAGTNAVFTSTVTNLSVNGSYIHKYTSVNGSAIPTATWTTGSNLQITGYTTATGAPGGLNQTFYNVIYNCPNQVANTNWGGTALNVIGTFLLASTGIDTLQLANTQAYTSTINNYNQTGGALDLSKGNTTNAQLLNITGTFNQTNGVIKVSNTTGSPTISFNGTTTQNVNFFNTAPSGRVTYRVNNGNGINLTGSGTLSSTPTFAINSGGGVRISTANANPINTTLTLQYAATGSTLTYDTVANYTATANVFPAANAPANITVNVGPSNAITLPFSRTVSGILTLTSGDINVGANTLTIGNATTNVGSIAGTGNVRLTTGALTRWYAAAAMPGSAGTGIGYYPISAGLANRNVSIYANGALTSGGTISVSHTSNTGLTTGLNVVDASGPYTINNRTNAYWTFTANGISIAAGTTFGVKVTSAYLFGTTAVANLRLMQQSAVAGTHVAGSGTAPNFSAERNGLQIFDLAGNYYIGAGNADITGIFTAINTGNWSAGTTWDKGVAPTISDNAVINPGVTVTVDAATNAAKALVVNGILVANANTLTIDSAVINNGTINLGGGIFKVNGGSGANGITNNATLNINSGTLTIGPSGGGNKAFTNNGFATVAGGTFNVNGYFNAVGGSYVIQSGGNINVDGNAAGVVANSVPAGTAIVSFKTQNLNFTAGTFTIVDPQAGSAATNNTFEYNVGSTAHVNLSPTHTFRMGDGVSTDPGGDATNGFRIHTAAASSSPGRLVFGNLVINSGTAANSFVIGQNAGSSFTPSPVGVLGNMTINAGGEYRNGLVWNHLYVNGNLTVNGTLTSIATLFFANYSNATISPSTTIGQTLSGTGTFRNAVSATPVANLLSITLQNANGVIFNAGNLSFSNALTFNAANGIPTRLYLANNSVLTEIGSSSASAANGWVVGRYQKNITTSNINANFPIGDAFSYAPVNVTAATGSVTTAGAIIAQTTTGNHPNIGSTTLNPQLTVNRYYTLTPANSIVIVPGSLTVNLQYQASDITGNANPSNFRVAAYSSGAWTYLPTSAYTFTAPLYKTPANGASLSVATDFQIADTCSRATIVTHPQTQTVCVGVPVTFSVAATGGGLTYQWKKNNVNVNTATSATYTINSPTLADAGDYTVVVSSICAGGPATSNVATLTVGSTAPPITTQPLTQTTCTGKNVTLGVVATGNGLLYQWKKNTVDIPLATSSTLPLNNIASADAGSYTVLVSNPCGGSTLSNAAILTVNISPAATVNAASATTFCAGNSVILNANTGTGLSYQWLLNGGSINNATASSYTANASGNYSVIVTSTNTCALTSTTTGVTVNPVPDATVIASGPTTFCAGDTVILNTGSTAGMSYQWKRNNSTVNGAIYPADTVLQDGSYTVTVTNTSTSCTATSAPTAVTVNALPVATITPAGTTTLCQDDSVVFAANTGNGLTYTWQLNGTSIYNATNNGYAAKTAGNYTVVVTDANSCVAISNVDTVVVNPRPLAVIEGEGPTTFCEGDSVTLKVHTGAGWIYQWTKDGININGAMDSLYTTMTGASYHAIVTNSYNCTDISQPIRVGVNELPVPVIFVNGSELSTTPWTAYQWYVDGNPIQGATNRTYTMSKSGVYSVRATNGNGCQGMSALDTIFNVGVPSISAQANMIRVYPNPASSMIHVEAAIYVNVAISSLEGKVILYREGAKDIDISQLPNAAYMIRITDEHGMLLKIDKLIKTGM